MNILSITTDYLANDIFNSDAKKAWRAAQRYTIETKWVHGAMRQVKVYEPNNSFMPERNRVFPKTVGEGMANLPYDYRDNKVKGQGRIEATEATKCMRLIHL